MNDIDSKTLRREYRRGSLMQETAVEDPIAQFAAWFADARSAVAIEPNAMALATATREGAPSARMVLLKSFDAAGFVFYTNYESRKGDDLASNSRAALLFYWAELERQVRIEGNVEKVSAAVSDEYFASRPRAAQIGAAISAQSRKVESRDALDTAAKELTARLGESPPPRPANWGGYIVRPNRFEFWQGRADRLHDRVLYELSEERWIISRLAP